MLSSIATYEENTMATSAVPLKVLIVDDHEPTAKILMLAMDAAGCQVQAVFNSIAAIEVLDSYIPDIVLLDINMPDMDGYKLCEMLRDDTRLGNALFIAQTGWNSDGHRKLSKRAGFHHHLAKPIDIEILLSTINREIYSARLVESANGNR